MKAAYYRMKRNALSAALFSLCGAGWLGGCASQSLPPISTVTQVDLQRFMGDWYVIAAIPTFIETEAYNAVESYRLNPDGTVATTFTCRKGSFSGPLKTYEPRGYVVDNTGNAVWGMQFVWPIKAEYVVVHLDPTYSYTVIGRSARDYAWVMARTPTMPAADYAAAVAKLEALGYPLDGLREVPQRWPENKPREDTGTADAVR